MSKFYGQGNNYISHYVEYDKYTKQWNVKLSRTHYIVFSGTLEECDFYIHECETIENNGYIPFF